MQDKAPFSESALQCHGATAETADGEENTRKLPFLIKRDGVWLYRGTPIKRKAMVCMFGSMLTRDEKGAYLLRTPFESGDIEVEDVTFLAVELDWQGAGRLQKLCFRTNIDEPVVASRDNPIRAYWQTPPDACCDGGCPPYLTIRAGDGAFPIEARLSRPVWYELAALAEPGQCNGVPCMGVWSCDCFFPLSLMPSDG